MPRVPDSIRLIFEVSQSMIAAASRPVNPAASR